MTHGPEPQGSRHSLVQDFRRARRQAMVEGILAWLGGRSVEALCYQDLEGLVEAKEGRRASRQEIPLRAIVGSVGRCGNYTRNFFPLKDSDQERWTGIGEAIASFKALPPIRVYRVGEVYFVADGHHRVSVARHRGLTHIQALVVEIRSRIGLPSHIQADDICPKVAYAHFLKCSQLDGIELESDLMVSAPDRYSALEAQIEAHGQFMALEERREVSPPEAAARWYEEMYLPAVRTLRQRQMQRAFPELTEADLYLWVCDHRAAVMKALDREIDYEVAVDDLLRQQGEGRWWRVARKASTILAFLQKKLIGGIRRQEP